MLARVALAATLALAAAPGAVARAQEEPVGPGQERAPQQGGAMAMPSAPGRVDLPNLPQVELQALPSYGRTPLTVGFMVVNGNPESGRFVSYRWNFGDGQASTLPPTSLFHTFTKPGSYVVTVTATTGDGLAASGFTGVIARPTGLH
jgi:PKD repeat protein